MTLSESQKQAVFLAIGDAFKNTYFFSLKSIMFFLKLLLYKYLLLFMLVISVSRLRLRCWLLERSLSG